jgi:hypothetical protein
MTVSTNFLSLTQNLAKGQIDFSTGSFKVMLVSVAPTEAELDAWAFRAAVTNEVVGTGYTAGGVAVTATVGAVDTGNNWTPITFTNLPSGWTTATITAVGCIIYQSVGTAGTDKLIQYGDFGAPVASTAGTFGLTFTTPIYIKR